MQWTSKDLGTNHEFLEKLNTHLLLFIVYIYGSYCRKNIPIEVRCMLRIHFLNNTKQKNMHSKSDHKLVRNIYLNAPNCRVLRLSLRPRTCFEYLRMRITNKATCTWRYYPFANPAHTSGVKCLLCKQQVHALAWKCSFLQFFASTNTSKHLFYNAGIQAEEERRPEIGGAKDDRKEVIRVRKRNFWKCIHKRI